MVILENMKYWLNEWIGYVLYLLWLYLLSLFFKLLVYVLNFEYVYLKNYEKV